jgi:phosphoribosylamine--glycine ligase
MGLNPEAIVFHNGTSFLEPSKLEKNGNIVTTGGRVFTLVSFGVTLAQARDLAYKEIRKLNFGNMRYRKQIGCPNQIEKQ